MTLSVALVSHRHPGLCYNMRFRIAQEPCEIRASDDVALFHGPRMGRELRRFSIAANGSLPPLAVLAPHFDRADVRLALSSGAVGYLLESGHPQVLAAALHCISHGRTTLAPQIAATHVRVASDAGGTPRRAPAAPTADATAGGTRPATPCCR
ncbi:hypothetical protein [Streptomyces sp. NPDC088554]|uniref:hypothetical protein n=1 Tax=Streptomyces sp. NPDC088554 TaxID=3365865 RepID=UPI0037FEBB91